jgi:hypothetical protein
LGGVFPSLFLSFLFKIYLLRGKFMSYKYSSGGYQIIGDLSGSDDSNRDTGIDFEENYISLRANNNDVLVVTGSNVGIGTSTPDSTLHIAGNVHISGSDQEGLRIAKGDDDYRQLVFENDGVDAASFTLSNAENLVIMNETAGKDIELWVDSAAGGDIEAVTIKESGKVGIGIDSPAEILHVSGNLKISGDDPRIKIDGDTDSHPGLEFYEHGTRKWIIFNDYTNDNLTFKTNSNTRMSIQQAGNVGIGTTSPIAELDVNGKIAITAEVATPSQPSDGQGYLYTKTDGKLYWRSYDVAETDLTQAGGGGGGSSASLEVTSQKTTNYTASNGDFVLVNLVGASGDVTITLPAASSDVQVAIKIAGAANGKIVTIDGNGAETIDGVATRTMETDYESIHLISDGSNWWRIS